MNENCFNLILFIFFLEFGGGAFNQQNQQQNGPFVGHGTGIAQPDAGGVGIALGIGEAVQSPLGGFTLGQGSSTSTGK